MSDVTAMEQAHEQRYLERCRAAKAEMVDSMSMAADRLGEDSDYSAQIARSILEAARDGLLSIDTHEFFGRISEPGHDWYIGLRGIFSDSKDPLVVDWRAPVSEGFYQATPVDPRGLHARRRHVFDNDQIGGYFDEDLSDPTAISRGGLADPVLFQMASERDGQMREVVATIQGEQDRIIRSGMQGCLIVQGGPGTGKTVVALHRLAYLLYTFRRELVGKPVLVLGPNPRFIEYISGVLPALGETAVTQRSVIEFFADRDTVRSGTELSESVLSAEALEALLGGMVALIGRFTEPVRARSTVQSAEELNELTDSALAMVDRPINYRRQVWRSNVLYRFQVAKKLDDRSQRELEAVLNKVWPRISAKRLVREAEHLATGTVAKRLGAIAKAAEKPGPRDYTDAVVVRLAELLANGPSVVYEHVVLDEAQDLSPVELAAIRMSARGSFTLVGDVAQSTRAFGSPSWSDTSNALQAPDARLAALTTGYRVPAEICVLANRLRPYLGVDVPELASARSGEQPSVVRCNTNDLASATAAHLAGLAQQPTNLAVLAHPSHHLDLQAALAAAGFTEATSMNDLQAGTYLLLDFGDSKGLEFEDVIVIEPSVEAIRGPRQAREVYVAVSRAVRRLTVVLSDDPIDLVAAV